MGGLGAGNSGNATCSSCSSDDARGSGHGGEGGVGGEDVDVDKCCGDGWGDECGVCDNDSNGTKGESDRREGEGKGGANNCSVTGLDRGESCTSPSSSRPLNSSALQQHFPVLFASS